MKKRFFAAAMAASMVVSSAMVASAATADVTIDASFTANTGFETLSGDFDVTYTFDLKSNGTNNWDNFILEFRTAENVGKNAKGEAVPVYVDMRADNFGWLANQSSGELKWAEVTSKWDTYNADMVAGVSCTVNVVREGNKFVATLKEGDKYTFVGTATCADFEGQDVIMTLTGEKCEITNAKFVNNTSVKNPSAGPEDPEVESTTKNPSAGPEDPEVESTTKNPSAGPEDPEAESTTKVETETTENDVTVVPETEAKDVVDAVQKLEDVADDAKVVVGTVDVPKGEKATADVAKLGLAGATKVKVYYMAADGTMKLLGEFPVNADGTVEFDSQGDVKYAFVAVASAEEETTTAKTEETTTAKEASGSDGKTDGGTKTGDSAPVAVLAAIATLAGAGVVVSRKKRA